MRAHTQIADGDIPFFDLPFLNLRGLARGRYQDLYAMSLHAEGRHKFRPRWGIIAFVEGGRVGNDFDELSSARTIVSYGGGIRWKVTKEQDINLGLDVGFSNDDTAVFIQIGEKY